jgi:glyoxylase-like metal-dependent hydrolase (beta-lactamase superfamily II)
MKIDLVLETSDTSLYLVDLPQPIEGFEHFICSWILEDRAKEIVSVVDCGPRSSIPVLDGALRSLKLRPDRLLLTHIHLDHGGGAGDLCRLYPDMTVTAHRRGLRHLVDPEILWEGSLLVLGDTATSYGKPLPVPEKSLNYALSDIFTIETPGHAHHHLSFLYSGDRRILFAGEVAGVCADRMVNRWYRDKTKKAPYLRPAAAPPFRIEIARESLRSILKLDHDLFCPGHYGPVDDGATFMEKALDQLNLWEETISLTREDEDPDALVGHLIKTDPALKPMEDFLPEVISRERAFMTNSVRGFMKDISDKN